MVYLQGAKPEWFSALFCTLFYLGKKECSCLFSLSDSVILRSKDLYGTLIIKGD